MKCEFQVFRLHQKTVFSKFKCCLCLIGLDALVVVRASGRVGRLLLFGRFCVVFGVFEIVYTRYFRTTCLLLSSGSTGVSRLPVLDCGMTFHPGFGGRDSPSILLDDL